MRLPAGARASCTLLLSTMALAWLTLLGSFLLPALAVCLVAASAAGTLLLLSRVLAAFVVLVFATLNAHVSGIG